MCTRQSDQGGHTMATRLRARFDGEVLRPEQPIDLQPNTTYLLTVEREVPPEEEAIPEGYPLTEIAGLASDLGVTDLAARHGWYAHGGAKEDHPGA